MSEIPVPKTAEILGQTLLTESVKKEWLDQPEGAWEKDLQAMAEILPAGILPLYQTLALDKQVHEKSGSQNRLHLVTIAALTETGDKTVWTNKDTAREVMGAVRSAIGDKYPDLLNEWDEGKSDTFSLLSASRIVVKELGFSPAEGKIIASESVMALMEQIDALPASTQKRIQALTAAVLDNLDNREDLEVLQEELQKSGVEAKDVAAWHEQLKKQRAGASVEAWEKMKTGGIGEFDTAGQRLMKDLAASLQKDLGSPETDIFNWNISREWQSKARYVKTWVGTAREPGRLTALFGGGEDGVGRAQQAFTIIWEAYLKGMGVVEVSAEGKTTIQLPEEALKRLPQYGQKVIEQAVSLVKGELYEPYGGGNLKNSPSLESVRAALLGPRGFLEKALGDAALAQAIFEAIKEKLLAPVEQMIEQGGEQFNALTRSGEKIMGEFVKDMAEAIGQGKVTEAELLENLQLVRKYGHILTPEQRQQLVQKGLEAYQQGAKESLAKPDELIKGIRDSLRIHVENNLQTTLEQIVSAVASGDDQALQQWLELWQKRTGAEFPQELVSKIQKKASDKQSIEDLLQAFKVALATVKTVKKK